MRKCATYAAAIAFAAAGFVSGCNQTDTTQVSQIIGDVQKVALAGCSFLPVPESIVAIYNANMALTAKMIGDAICNAVANMKAGAHPGSVLPVVRVGGEAIVVKGQFVH